MQSDTDRWNKKYQKRNPNPDFIPDETLTVFADAFDGKGRALDLACGVGHNALWLAQLGYEVDALDASPVGLSYLRRAASERNLYISTQAADLDDYELAESAYDAIIVVRYRKKSLYRPIVNALKPGGVLLFKTFNKNYLIENENFNSDFVLQPGELNNAFKELQLIAGNDGPNPVGSSTYWLGAKIDP